MLVTQKSVSLISVIRSFTARARLCLACILVVMSVQAPARTSAAGPAAEAEGGQSLMLVVQLKTEHLAEPLGIEAPRPRFRWLLESAERGHVQTAFPLLEQFHGRRI